MASSAAGFVYLFGDLEVVPIPKLRILAETPTTVTLGWEPVPSAAGYRFSSEGGEKLSHTWDPLFARDSRYPPCNTRFAKGAGWYRVEILSVDALIDYP